jgi:ATP-dependent protease HslVU (ClpYQ) ATPase subunit
LQPGDEVVITKALVEDKVSGMLKSKDLSKFIL